jgi:hypothetical protein
MAKASSKASSKIVLPQAGIPVIRKDCEECCHEFQQLIQNAQPQSCNLIQQAFTSSIGFNAKNLCTWLANNAKGKVDEVRITLGVYTPSFIKKYNLNISLTGRITAFIWLYYKNNPAATEKAEKKAYNLGNIQP